MSARKVARAGRRKQEREERAATIAALRRDIETLKAAEATEFAAWEAKLDEFALLSKTKAYLDFRRRVMDVQGKWKGSMYDLRKLLEEAGLGPAEAMREQPDEARLKRLVDRSRIG